MEEISKLDLSSSCSSYYGCGDHGFEMEQKGMSILDQVNSSSSSSSSYQYTMEKAESYVIDMDAFSSGINKDSTNSNSRISRSLSRKGSQRVGDRKINGLTTLQIHDNKDCLSAMCSPIATHSGTPILPAAMAVVSADHSINPHAHQQSNIGGTTTTTTTTTTEGRSSLTRRNSFIRSSSWTVDPKRVLIFFATLSSMGTMLLIYFTLVSNKQNADEYVGHLGGSSE
ncbi:uncharacterized protein LOC123909533 isoform X1 [Trifolium pratense]|nr:uncharacterized protein LOC123909533 isoform X1 [Trifolium pratense]